MDLRALPGGDLVSEGLDDLAHGRETIAALLVSIGAPLLRERQLRARSRVRALVYRERLGRFMEAVGRAADLEHLGSRGRRRLRHLDGEAIHRR
jgi:hypothetical protein